MKKLTIIVLLVTITSFNLSAQLLICGADNTQDIEHQNPEHALKLQEIEEQTQKWIRGLNEHKTTSNVVTIPTVFHIIHTGTVSADDNIQEHYILSQLEQMNDDFRRLNSDADDTWPQAADSEIEFCLASVDPNGNPTNGIIRHLYNTGTWTKTDFNSTVKPNTIWNRDHYLNVWVVPNPLANNGDPIGGYAQFPGGGASTDGIVVITYSVGSLDNVNPIGGNANGVGRIAAHEVGHWLNLRHIWGDGNCDFDDGVGDTPLSDAFNTGCNIGHVSCGTVDMVQNYMDYSFGSCMNLFTQGQKDRMQALFAPGGSREGLLNSMGCTGGGSGPDLIISSKSVSSNTVACGGSITGYATVKNNGGSTASGSYLYYYLSTDTVLDNNDTNLGWDILGNLTANATSNQSAPFSIPNDLSAGTYYILFITDPTNVVAESNENNNVAFEQITITCVTGPDLIVSSKSVSSNTVACGDVITGNATVTNIGNASAGSGSRLRYYLSTNMTWSSDDIFLKQDWVINLSAGNFNLENAPLTIPDDLASGTYYILFRADAIHDVSETNENNNVAFEQITVTCVNGPDLIVSSKSVSANTVACGDVITGNATVTNIGNASAGSGSRLRYYLSTNTTWSSDDTFLGQDWVINLSAGNFNLENAPLTIPDDLASGTYYILFRADAIHDVSETNENNNVAFEQITVTCVTAPDLIISSKSVSANTVACGASITGYATVKNNGNSTASGSYLYYYLSTDTVLDNNDTNLGWDILGNLAANATSNQSATFSIPSNLSAGTYYILFMTDPTNVVAESNENNNVAFEQITVTCGGNNCQSTVSTFPYYEGFESGLGLWTQDTNDDFNWTRTNVGTPSSNTGPTSASEGSYYVYTEASNNFNNTANLVSPCFDLSNMSSPVLTCKYHMYGASMGTLTAEVSTDNGVSWDLLFSSNNGSSNFWKTLTLTNLNLYTGQVVQIRFRGVTGDSYTSDMAVDDISITDAGGRAYVETEGIDVRNYPNPFSVQTTIEFDLPEDAPVTIFVSDMTGKQVAVLLDEEKYAGKHQVIFDGTNHTAGMYYYTIQAGEYVTTQKMILTK